MEDRNKRILAALKRLESSEQSYSNQEYIDAKKELEIAMNQCPLVESKKPKQTMEVNGVANISMLLDVLQYESPSKEELAVALNDIRGQVVLLERYMLAFNKAVQDGTANPFWHEVKANPSAYPTNREKNKR